MGSITQKIIASMIVISLFTSNYAFAIAAELGASYGRKKTTIDEFNYDEQESTTGSLSFYFLERVALEFSYTSSLAVRNQLVSGNTELTVQKTKVFGSDLILVLADKTAFIQPYIKGGVARLERQKNVRVNNLQTESLEPEIATVPSYGAGFKLNITQTFGVKVSYDVWRTPIGGDNYTDDNQLKAGLTWMLFQ
ncbi:MAG: outer membrane beta-barrel protein [Bdellovibrionota bacterium]